MDDRGTLNSKEKYIKYAFAQSSSDVAAIGKRLLMSHGKGFSSFHITDNFHICT